MYLFRTLLIPSLALVAACSSQPRFHRMSAEELHAYNSTQPYSEQVFCQTLTSSSSHIAKLRCRTRQEWAEGNVLATMRLNVLDYSGAVYYIPGY